MHRMLISFSLILAALLLAACSVEDVGDLAQAIADAQATEDARQAGGAISVDDIDSLPGSSFYEIYFTNPTCPPEAERVDGVDDIIAADLLAAREQVDVAVFDFDSPVLTDALIELEKRGLPVRMVTDEDNGDLSAIRRLRNAGISVVEDKRRALMHDKFIIIDHHIVWTGSLNFTTNGVFCNNNNIVRFDSAELAENYTAEMDEMYIERAFGPTSPNATPHENLTIQGVRIENYFGPEKEMAPVISRFVARARNEILFMAFAFTDDDIGESMLGRAEGGVTIRGVFERVGSDTSFSYYPLMHSLGMPNVEVRVDGNPRIMHHKVIIIDRESVLFGSFNFSEGANRSNDENVVIVHDPEFTRFFVEEFDLVWAEASVVEPGQ